jgi:hypothetical protein
MEEEERETEPLQRGGAQGGVETQWADGPGRWNGLRQSNKDWSENLFLLG